jgi:hypothetical protein
MFGNGDPNDHCPEAGFWNAISRLLRGATRIIQGETEKRNTSAFLGTNPTGELITSGLLVIDRR